MISMFAKSEKFFKLLQNSYQLTWFIKRLPRQVCYRHLTPNEGTIETSL